MPLTIKINNLNKKVSIDRKSVKKSAGRVFRKYRKKDALIDITFVSDKKIKALNKKYMGRTGATDVLSFLLEEKSRPRRSKLIGDIYISSDMARRNSKRFKTSLARELVLYTVHGALHLVGFGDETAREKIKIRKLEDRFLKELF